MVEPKYKKSHDLIAVLLDTAERLFAEKGYYGVSVRDITGAAGVRNASINYHFGSKEALFISVIRRRADPLCEARMVQLRKVEIDPMNTAETVRALVNAFAQPMFDFATNGDPGWRHYCVLIAHLSVQSHMGGAMVADEYDHVAQKFLEAFGQLFPEADDYRIQSAFQFMLSTTLYAVCDNGRIDRLSAGKFRSADLSNKAEPFMDYVSGGIVATLAPE